MELAQAKTEADSNLPKTESDCESKSHVDSAQSPPPGFNELPECNTECHQYGLQLGRFSADAQPFSLADLELALQSCCGLQTCNPDTSFSYNHVPTGDVTSTSYSDMQLRLQTALRQRHEEFQLRVKAESEKRAAEMKVKELEARLLETTKAYWESQNKWAALAADYNALKEEFIRYSLEMSKRNQEGRWLRQPGDGIEANIKVELQAAQAEVMRLREEVEMLKTKLQKAEAEGDALAGENASLWSELNQVQEQLREAMEAKSVGSLFTVVNQPAMSSSSVENATIEMLQEKLKHCLREKQDLAIAYSDLQRFVKTRCLLCMSS